MDSYDYNHEEFVKSIKQSYEDSIKRASSNWDDARYVADVSKFKSRVIVGLVLFVIVNVMIFNNLLFNGLHIFWMLFFFFTFVNIVDWINLIGLRKNVLIYKESGVIR